MERSFAGFDEVAKQEFFVGLSSVTGASLDDFHNAKFRKGCVICRVRLPFQEAMRLLEMAQKHGYKAGIELTDDPSGDLTVYAEFLNENDVSEIRDLDFEVPIVTSKTKSKIPTVVLVHGWKSDPTQAFGDLPERLGEAAGVDVCCYQYQTGVIGKFPNLISITHNMDNDISRRTARSNTIALIGHSLGGILVRRLVLGLQDGTSLKGKNVPLLTLIASPSVGSSLSAVPDIATAFTNDQLRDLRKNSRFLQDLIPRWTAWQQKYVPQQTQVRAIYGDRDKVVPKSEAMLFDPRPVAMLGADHSTVVKPETDQMQIELLETLHHFLIESGISNKSLS